MTINYSPLLQLAEPVTGTESGVWGDIVNQQITLLVEAAVAGASSIDVTSGNVTLTTTTGSGGNQSRSAVLLVTGTPGTSRNVVGAGTSKIYLVKNGSDSSIVIKASGTTGVTLSTGTTAWVYWNGSDYVFASPVFTSSTGVITGNIPGNAGNVSGTVAIANGGTGQTTAAAALSALGGINTGKSIAMAMIFGF